MKSEIFQQPTMLDFTIAIPTYNRASYIPQMLERLCSQINVENLRWEIIFVDNNSTDNTEKIIKEYQTRWQQAYPLRYCFEAEQGATFARQRAVWEARSELIGFLDDDNFPAEDWLAAAYSFGIEHPEVGVYGGQIHGVLEEDPPENFERIRRFLAVNEQGQQPFLYKAETLSLPTGAAFVVRQKAWMESVPQRRVFKGRVGKSLLGGEDWEVMLHIYKAGWQLWYNPAMHTYHQIPSYRLEKDYLVSMIRGAALCTCQLRMIPATGWQKLIIIVRLFLGNLRRIVLHLIKYRRQVKTDLVPACEMAFYWGNFLSIFYFLSISFKKDEDYQQYTD